MRKDVCAVVVTFNPEISDVETLIGRVAGQVGMVVIVDNGSSNAGALSNFPGRLIELGSNTGVATAQNIGIRYALERDYRFVILFDHDSLPMPDMIEKLVAAHEELTAQGVRVAAVGPNYTERNGGVIQEPSRRTGLAKKDMIISSGALFSVEALRDVGLMREDLFIDYVDTEWCMRARRKWREHNYRVETARCWKIYMVRDALMGHAWSAGITRVWAGVMSSGLVMAAIVAISVPRDFSLIAAIGVAAAATVAGFRLFPVYPPIRQYYMMRNAIDLYLRSPYQRSWKLRDAVSRGAVFLAAVLGAFPGRWQHLRMMLLGVLHGVRGRRGPLEPSLSYCRHDVTTEQLEHSHEQK